MTFLVLFLISLIFSSCNYHPLVFNPTNAKVCYKEEQKEIKKINEMLKTKDKKIEDIQTEMKKINEEIEKLKVLYDFLFDNLVDLVKKQMDTMYDIASLKGVIEFLKEENYRIDNQTFKNREDIDMMLTKVERKMEQNNQNINMVLKRIERKIEQNKENIRKVFLELKNMKEKIKKQKEQNMQYFNLYKKYKEILKELDLLNEKVKRLQRALKKIPVVKIESIKQDR